MPPAGCPRFERDDAIARLRASDFDVLVVGGGITGAGVALDAATRGLRVALLERHDFASGTSSRSSRLVHGGLRYLDRGELRLVAEGLAERQRLLENAPHLVRVLPFLVPVFRGVGPRSRRVGPLLGAALWAYDAAGGIRVGRRHRHVGIDEAVRLFPRLTRDRVRDAYLLFDAHADDARLTLTVARTAVGHGAVALNYAEVVGFLRDRDRSRVVGARVRIGDEVVEIRARAVVNAAGVWSDAVRALDEHAGHPSIRPGKGVHVTLPRALVRNEVAAIIPSARDRRSVFVVPWGDHTYVGTTDTEYEGPLDEPTCTVEDAQYLLDALNAVTDLAATRADITSTWAGLRPLLQAPRRSRTADLSRRHAVVVSPAGVVTVTGGKLTTYRRMAADAVDAALGVLGAGTRHPRCATKHLRMLGAGDAEPDTGASHGDSLDHLTGRYGTEAAAIRALVDEEPSRAAPLVAGLPYLRAEAVYAARHEMAYTLDDVLSRRTRASTLAWAAASDAAPDVAALLAAELGWSPADCEREVCAYRRAAACAPPS